jgi:hypothetical protein
VDPFLLTHRITDALFDIGPGFTPPSLRDQTIRGWLLANKAAAAGIIGPTKPLLIVGAGLAGAVTALTAASLNVPTTVIDRADKPLNVQLGCFTRVLCPAQYDWPAHHWSDGRLPWNAKIPLLWQLGRAGDLALGLGREFLETVERLPHLTFMPHTEIPEDQRRALKDQAPQGDFRINFVDAHTKAVDPTDHRFAAVFSCLGPGVERSSVGTYSGFRFWKMDPFSIPNLNLDVTPKVYISGAGDGALQDFLRIATGYETAREIFLSLPAKTRDFIELEVRTKEENFKRAHSLFVQDDHGMHQQIFDHHSRIVDEVLKNNAAELDAVFGSMLSNLSNWTLRLSYRCNHFTNYYCLNAILTLIVSRYWEWKTGVALLRPQSDTVQVNGINAHVCKNSPWNCHGEDHEVISRVALCSSATTTVAERVESPFNVVILRHGPALPSESFFGLPVQSRRQLLPYYI